VDHKLKYNIKGIVLINSNNVLHISSNHWYVISLTVHV